MESEGKLGPAIFLSWADEVEKEDEEAARAQVQRKEKPNPFGSARPREVVLQEKGIDWRKLDLHLEQQAPLARREPLSEKCKGNIAASSPSSINRKHTEPQGQGLNDENLGFNSAATDQVVVVPPLKYPPRNIVASLSYSGISYINPCDLESGKHGFQYRSSLKPEKKNTTGRSGIRMIHCHERRLHIEHGSQFKKNGIQSESAQSLGKKRNLSKPLACSNRQHSDSYNRGGEFEGNGHDTMASLLGRPPIRERKPLSPSERAWKSVKDDPTVREVNKLHTKQSRTRCGNMERKRWSQRTSYKDTTVSQEDCRSGMDRHVAYGK